MQVFDRMTIPIRRVWTGVATRFGVRKSGMVLLWLVYDLQTVEQLFPSDGFVEFLILNA
ncbi:hypothetical protein Gotur_007071 [Gossypium turneri]